MPKVRTNAPAQSKQKGQRSLQDPLYLNRIPNYLYLPTQFNAASWRSAVDYQPVALACRETLIANLLALQWKVEPRDSSKRDELKSEIDYYTKFFEYTGDYDYAEIIEWVAKDYLDLPFGGAVELGHQGDSPEGKLLWIELLDGGTLIPTLNRDWPVGQKINGLPQVVYFPKHAINRVYMSPRTEINRKGWGIAPPEKIYMALQLLYRGDQYYANLLLDTPQVGILDLLDMSKDSAEEWVNAWKALLTGIDPYKIPVIYEHTQKAEWIPFTRPPSEIMFDVAMGRYGALTCAGYGMTLSDIGLGGGQSGGNTLAGTIRDERKTKRTGFARLKIKLEAFFNRMLPSDLKFHLIDLDDEFSVALGRARLANATAWGALIGNRVFTPEEARQQTIADGLTSITLPEKLPEELKPENQMQPNTNGAERPSMLGRPVTPSSGGWGEVAARSLGLGNLVDDYVKDLTNNPHKLQRMMYLAMPSVSTILSGWKDALEEADQVPVDGWVDQLVWGDDDGGDLLPELLKPTLSFAQKSVYDGLDFPDNPDNDFVALYSHIRENVTSELQRRSFVEGKDYLAEIKLIEQSEFEQKCNECTDKAIEAAKNIISKAVVAGLLKYLTANANNIGELLTVYDLEANNTVLSHVKEGLALLKSEYLGTVCAIINQE